MLCSNKFVNKLLVIDSDELKQYIMNGRQMTQASEANKSQWKIWNKNIGKSETIKLGCQNENHVQWAKTGRNNTAKHTKLLINWWNFKFDRSNELRILKINKNFFFIENPK